MDQTNSKYINRNRLIKVFLQLVKIPSPSGQEAAMRTVTARALRKLGVRITVDSIGNVIGRLPGVGTGKTQPPFLLEAHLDTVTPCVGIKPVIRGNKIMTDGTTILGADDKAGVAAIIEVVTILRERKLDHCPLEIVLAVSEEQYNRGAKALDVSKLKSPYGLVIDGGDISEIDYAAPFISTFDVTVMGKAAHSGLEPEKGISAIHTAATAISHMKLGRINSNTTANIGMMSGGQNRNVIPDRVTLVGEVRSHSHTQLENQLERIQKALTDAAEQFGAAIDFKNNFDVPGYTVAKNDPFLKRLRSVIEAHGIKTNLRKFCAATDANVFNNRGIETLDLGTGMRNPHTVEEYLLIDEFIIATAVVLGMVVTPLPSR